MMSHAFFGTLHQVR